MPKFDYVQIQRDLRAANVTKFRTTPLYSGVPVDQAGAIEKRYIDGTIQLPEFSTLIESLRKTAQHQH